MEPKKDIFEEWSEKKIPLLTKLKWKLESVVRVPNNIRQGVKNLVYWLPMIWNDRNWDSYYTLKMLSHKLKSQSEYIDNMDRHTTTQKDVRNMRTCIRLIDKVNEEYYAGEYADYAVNKHWFEPIPGKNEYTSWETRELSENYDDYFNKYPLIHKRVLDGESTFSTMDNSKVTIAMDIAYINQKRAHKLLFKILHDEMLGWWD